MALKNVSDLSLQEFRFLLEEGLYESGDEVELDIYDGFYLELPEIEILRYGKGFSAEYSPLFRKNIAHALEERMRDREPDAPRLADIYHNKLRWRSIERIQKEKVAMMDWVAKEQAGFLLNGKPRYLKNIHEGYIATALKEFGWCTPKVNTLVRDLSVKLPNGKPFGGGDVVFAKELVPGGGLMAYRATHVLRQLMKKDEYYSGGAWQVSDEKLDRILRHYGIDVNEKTLINRKRKLEGYLK